MQFKIDFDIDSSLEVRLLIYHNRNLVDFDIDFSAEN